ncbi:MAG: hypothetical protein AAF587_44325, partial [Bacteroidota bacterium]
ISRSGSRGPYGTTDSQRRATTDSDLHNAERRFWLSISWTISTSPSPGRPILLTMATICADCYADLQPLQQVQLKPCKHRLCLYCMIDFLHQKRQEKIVQCPCCTRNVDNSSYERIPPPPDRRGRKRTRDEDDSPDEDIDPITKEQEYQRLELKENFDDLRKIMANLVDLREKGRKMAGGPDYSLLKDAMGNEGVLVTLQYSIHIIWKTQNDTFSFMVKPICHSQIKSNAGEEEAHGSGLVSMFAALSNPILLASAQDKDTMPEEVVPATRLCDYIEKDGRLLPLCIHALATGNDSLNWVEKTLSKKGSLDTYDRSLVCAPYLAADMIERVSNPSKIIGVACRSVSELADTMENHQFLDFLSSPFRVITQTNTRRRGRAAAFVNMSMRQQELDPRCLVIAMTDNVENKVVDGPDAGTFESNTLVAYATIPSSTLLEDGILNDDDPSARLSRVSKSWKQLVAAGLSMPPSGSCTPMEMVLDQYLRPTDSDNQELGSLVLLHIAAALQAKAKGWLPGEMPTADTVPNDGSIKLPITERLFLESQLVDVFTAATISEERPPVNTATHEELKTLWTKNHIQSSYALDLPFSANSTQVEILEMDLRILLRQLCDYYHINNPFDEAMPEDTSDTVLEQDDEEEECTGLRPLTQGELDSIWKLIEDQVKEDDKDPPPSYTLFLNACDGSPVGKIYRLKYSDEKGRWKKQQPIIGGFHFFMETFKCSNSLHTEDASFLVGSFIGKKGKEATPENIKCFLNFGDPTMCEKQMGAILCAIYSYVARQMKVDQNGATAIDVYSYMVERAKQSSIYPCLLEIAWHAQPCRSKHQSLLLRFDQPSFVLQRNYRWHTRWPPFASHILWDLQS